MIKPTFSYHIVTGLPSGPIAQRPEYSHCLRGVLEASPGLVMCFFLPVTFGGSVWVCDRATSSKGTVSLVYSMVTSRFGSKSISAGGNCHRPTEWPNSSVVRVLAPYLVTQCGSVPRLRAAKGLSRWFQHGSIRFRDLSKGKLSQAYSVAR